MRKCFKKIKINDKLFDGYDDFYKVSDIYKKSDIYTGEIVSLGRADGSQDECGRYIYTNYTNSYITSLPGYIVQIVKVTSPYYYQIEDMRKAEHEKNIKKYNQESMVFNNNYTYTITATPFPLTYQYYFTNKK